MISENNILKIFGKNILFTSEEMDSLKNKEYDRDGSTLEVVLWGNDVENKKY